jgi:flagellar biosynthesis anti-sigma factor FlgM
MDIQGPDGIQRTPRINRAKSAGKAYKAAASQTRKSDAVEISDKALMLSKLSQVPDVRWDKVLAIKSAIENGEYETPEKLESAIMSMIDQEFGIKPD